MQVLIENEKKRHTPTVTIVVLKNKVIYKEEELSPVKICNMVSDRTTKYGTTDVLTGMLINALALSEIEEDDNVMSYINHSQEVKATIIKHCDVKYCKEYRDDSSVSIRKLVAMNGSDRDLEYLARYDDDYSVLRKVARYGTSKSLRIMSEDSDVRVRKLVVPYAHKTLMNKLVRDESSRVRALVATHGDDYHRDVLRDSKDEVVRKALLAHST